MKYKSYNINKIRKEIKDEKYIISVEKTLKILQEIEK